MNTIRAPGILFGDIYKKTTMTPTNFQGSNAVFGANQPEYLPLPAEIRGDDVITCWRLTAEEIERVCDYGEIFITLKTFGQPLQPILCSVDKPENF